MNDRIPERGRSDRRGSAPARSILGRRCACQCHASTDVVPVHPARPIRQDRNRRPGESGLRRRRHRASSPRYRSQPKAAPRPKRNSPLRGSPLPTKRQNRAAECDSPARAHLFGLFSHDWPIWCPPRYSLSPAKPVEEVSRDDFQLCGNRRERQRTRIRLRFTHAAPHQTENKGFVPGAPGKTPLGDYRGSAAPLTIVARDAILGR